MADESNQTSARWRVVVWPLAVGGAFAVGLAVPRPWAGDEVAGDAVVRQTVVGEVWSGGSLAGDERRGGQTRSGAGERDELAGGVVWKLTGIELEELAVEALRDPSHLKRSLAFSKLLEGLTAEENAEEMMGKLKEFGAGRDQWGAFPLRVGGGGWRGSVVVRRGRWRTGEGRVTLWGRH